LESSAACLVTRHGVDTKATKITKITKIAKMRSPNYFVVFVTLYHFAVTVFLEIAMDDACGSCGKRVLCVFQGAVDAVCASTAPAASTGVLGRY
jgi:hypothetical protein